MRDRSRGSVRTWRAAGLLLGVAAAGCGAQTADVTEGKQAALKAHQVALARQVGQLPSLTMPYSVFELFDDPVEISSTAAQCVVGGDINEQGTMVGFDCRANQRWYATTNVALPGLIGALPSLAGLSSTVINHTATAALPAVTGATVVAPSVINEIGDIGASVYYNATAKWGVALFKGGSHTPRTVTFPNQAQVLAMGEGSTPMLYGAMTQAGSSVWGGFKYQTTATGTGETLTYLGTPGGNTTSWSVAAFNTHHGNKHDLVGSSATTTGYAAAWVYQDGAASPWLDLTAIKTGTAFERLETARDVNNSRKVIGYGLLPNGTTASYYRRGYIFDLETGENIDLGVIPGGGYGYPKQEYVPNSINALGHVVGGIYSTGSLTGPSIYPARGFFWSKETGMKDLNSFIPTNLGVTLVAGLKINNNGDVIGIAQMASGGPYRLFRLRINLGVPTFYQPADGKPCSNAVAINVSGTVLGRSDNCGSLEGDSGTSIPWVARAGAGPEGLAPPAGATLVVPGGINDYDVAAATWSNGSTLASVRWDLVAGTTTTGPPNVTTTAINTGLPYATVGQDARTSPAKGQVTTYGDPEPIAPPSGGSYGAGSSLGVNDGGDVVGYSTLDGLKVATVRLAGGANRSLNLSTTGPSAWTWFEEATDINNGRWVVGSGTRDGRKRAFRIPVGTGGINPLDIEDLGTLDSDLAGTMAYRARAISNKGYVVGTAATVDGITGALTPQRGFVYTRGSGMTDLNVLLLMPAGWEIREATDINDNDEVVGWAQQGATGIKRGFKVKLPPLQNFLCYGKDNGTPCDDGNACTKTDVCQGGLCVSNPACMTDNPCLGQGTCTDMATGACSYPTKLAAGTSCSDNDACTSGDTCDGAGTCTPGAPVTLTCGAAPDASHTAGVCDKASRPVMPTNGLIGWWRLENDGTDSGPAGNPLLPTSNVLFTGGKSGGAASFDGGTACLSAPAPKEAQIVGSTGVTLMAWIKIPSNFQCPAANVAKKVISKGNDISLGVTCANGTPRVSLSGHYPNMSSYGNGFGQHVITPNVWHHIAVTWAPKANPSAAAYGTYYYDGQWDGGIGWTGPEANPGLSNEDGSLTLGCFSAAVYWMGVPFQGQIDEVAMYGRALPAAEIASVYSATSNAGPTCTYPLKPEIADCVAKAEGDWCQHGKWCGENGNNVCHNGVCGGGDPADNFCLHAKGVADLGGGKAAAIFGVENKSQTTVLPVPNTVEIDGVVTAFPDPAPPPWLPPVTKADAYVAKFPLGSDHRISWRVNGQKATQTGIKTLDPIEGEPGIVVSLDGENISIVPDLASYSVPPALKTAVDAAPAVGAEFKGALEGQFAVGPTGAATYTLPIKIPPGIAGMAPNLSLVYNSQGGPGIAGEGWSLSGLSMVHQCAKTRIQDGIAKPVTLDDASAGMGVCLDGKRLFEDEDHEGQYFVEVNDFSAISRVGKTFVVKTKSGETRFYGLNPKSRVTAPAHFAPTILRSTMIYPLDRVVDAWGNYFDITYNDNAEDFQDRGLIVTEIKYTGNLPTNQDTFHSITFQYSSTDRKDQRTTRFGRASLPLKKLLTGITTPMGSYTLGYVDPASLSSVDRLMLPSELETIKYCAKQSATPGQPAPCLPELRFGWTGGGFTSMESSTDSYKLPAPIDRYLNDEGNRADRGTRFVDLDGDGLVDVVQAQYIWGSWWHDLWNGGPEGLKTNAWRNTGAGFEPKPQWALPSNLVDGDGQAGGSALADMDGDGKLDFVTHYHSGNFPTFTAGTLEAPSAVPGGPPALISHPSFVVFLNRVTPSCQGAACWQISTLSELTPWVSNAQRCQGPLAKVTGHRVNLLGGGDWTDYLADMNGDGRADLVRVVHSEYCGQDPITRQVISYPSEQYVLINNKTGWIFDSKFSFRNGGFRSSNPEDYRLEDVNRDGLADLVNHQIDSNSNVYVGLNSGATNGGTVWRPDDSPVDPNWNTNGEVRSVGDINGDGFHDPVAFNEIFADISRGSQVQTFEIHKKPSITFGLGVGYTTDGTQPYKAALDTFIPDQDPPLSGYPPVAGIPIAEKVNFIGGMVDLNADGLADLLLNHSNGAQPLVNTGTTWVDLNGATSRQTQAGAVKLKFVPSDYAPPMIGQIAPAGGAFVDINGDGATDLVRAVPGSNNTITGGTYLNTYVRPRIETFPAGLARQTEVAYVVTTSKAARDASVYSDPIGILPGTTASPLPMQVVSEVTTQDGRGYGPGLVTKYQYESLRGSAYGRGPQGFRKVIVTEPSDVPEGDQGLGTVGTRTETTYSQVFPYTGMPILVEKSKDGVRLSKTVTKYCDRISTTSAPPDCVAADGAGVEYPIRSNLQVYAREITDASYPVGGASGEKLVTQSTFTQDRFGNTTKIVVDLTHATEDPSGGPDVVSESHRSTSQSWYGETGSGPEAEQGKVTWTEVTTVRTDGVHPAITHKTAFDYGTDGGFQVDVPAAGLIPGGTVSRNLLVLKKKRVEPGTRDESQAALVNSTELHTAYAYDAFGNVITTTTCASDFASCEAGGTNPVEDGGRHPAFRTTTVSYDPGSFNNPSGSGSDLVSTPGYQQRGRFPVRSENSLGHVEFSLHDATTGLLKQTTSLNGVHACYRYDEFGFQTAQIVRCGSDHPLETTVRRYQSLGVGGSELPVVTVTRPPSASPTWTYSDVLGRAAATITYGFDGHLVETGRTTWDRLGRVRTTSKPRAYPSGDVYLTTHKYDRLGPERVTIQELGRIGAPGEVGTSSTIRGFNGMSVVTIEMTTSEDPQTHIRLPIFKTRTETKNALGKVETVSLLGTEQEATASVTSYSYDADGNLTGTRDPAGNVVQIGYDSFGRKTFMNDPDLGTWTFTYDGFGDLLEQTDAKQAVTSMLYDALGRVTSRMAGGKSSLWVYDVADHGKGKLAAMVGPPDVNLAGTCAIQHAEGATSVDGNRPGRWFRYDATGAVEEEFECIDGTTFSTQYQYDPASARQIGVRYPEIDGVRMDVQYVYSPLGYLQYLTEGLGGALLWAATEQNAAGQVTAQKARNGVDTTFDLSPGIGWVLGSTSTSHAERDKVIQHWTYRFDEAGNLRTRHRDDAVNDGTSTESFGYDSLDRLKSARTEGSYAGGSTYDVTESFSYDKLGNLTFKNGAQYAYAGCDAGPHAVCSTGETTFQYDDNGGMIAGGGRTVDYAPNHKPSHILDVGASASVDFAYGANDQRVLQAGQSQAGEAARTVYVGMGDTGKSLYERTTTGTSVEHTQFVYAADGGAAFAVRVVKTTGVTSASPRWNYFHTDHIGSVTAISDDFGHVIEAAWGGASASLMGYDAWGARRNPDGRYADPKSFQRQVGHREFTGHEAIPGVGLVNMNGRVYDPVLGRFLSPDPTVQFVANLQSLNRYSYVLNNPLRYTDPTGYRAVFSGDIDSAITVGLTAAAMVGCAIGGPTGAACIAAAIAGTAWNVTTMRVNGAAWGDIIALEGMTAIAGYMIGQATTGVLGETVMAGLISGTISGAVNGAISAAVMGGDLGDNVLQGAIHGAMEAAASVVVSATVSAASEMVASWGGGTGAAQAERLETSQPTPALSDDAPPPPVAKGRLVVGPDGQPLHFADNQSVAPRSCGATANWQMGAEVINGKAPTTASDVETGFKIGAKVAGVSGAALRGAGDLIAPFPKDVDAFQNLAKTAGRMTTTGRVLGATGVGLNVAAGGLQYYRGTQAHDPMARMFGAAKVGAAVAMVISGPVGITLAVAIFALEHSSQ